LATKQTSYPMTFLINLTCLIDLINVFNLLYAQAVWQQPVLHM